MSDYTATWRAQLLSGKAVLRPRHPLAGGFGNCAILRGVQTHMSRWLTVLVLLGCHAASAQPAFVAPRAHEQKTDSPPGDPLIDPDQSAVYMEFRKVGRCTAQDARESEDRIWLALKNNTRWQVLVRANGVENECYGDATPMYHVEANGSDVPDGPIPHGHWLDVASLVEIDTGEVLVFSVPKIHLDPGLSIRVDFEFSWEKNHRYTRYSSYISYWDLPKGLRDREKEKKLKCVRGPCELKIVPPPKPPELPDPPALNLHVIPPDLPTFLSAPRLQLKN